MTENGMNFWDCPLETRGQEASLGLSSECPRDYVGNRK